MCFFTRLNSLDVQIQVYFTLRTVTVVSHVFDMLSGVSLSLAKKRSLTEGKRSSLELCEKT